MDEAVQVWLDRLFGETEANGVDRLVELDEFCPPDRSTFARLAQVFESPAVWLAPYSEAFVSQAFWDLIQVFGELGRTPADWDLHLRVFRSFEVLFREYFAVRCTPELAHLSEGGALNEVCYMWWDFDCWDFIPDDIFLSMLRSILAINHAACQESALHGLGHNSSPEAEAIIDDFLLREPNLRPDLREYALRARKGKIM
ncbi:MAG TPA: hypothetical protein VMT15_21170 [Bryobacteraceae bacterium]|nr:hypothetical protein [Bryobacteraceae bacterium]